MKVLMISFDNSILSPQSEAAERMRSYGAICDALHVIVLTGSGQITQLGGNVFVCPAAFNGRLRALFNAYKIGRNILCKGGKWIITTQEPFEAGLIGWLLAKKFGCGLEVQLHGDFYGSPYWRREKFINKLRFILGKFILRRADGIRVVSERIKKSIESFVKGKISKVPVSIEMGGAGDPQYLKNKFPGAYPIILAAGNLVPVKNHKLLIEVFAEVKKELPRAKLVIVGDGPLKEGLQLTAYSLRLENDVWLAGHQNNLADFYSSADIFVHPSLYEGWGRAVIEAAHFGLPIIMTDVGLANEVIMNNESGLVVLVNSIELLKDGIIKLANDRVLALALAARAKEAIKKIPNQTQATELVRESWVEFEK